MCGDLAEYVPHVYRLALRLTGNIHLAEDLTQETFLRAWQRISQLAEERAARAWLFRIAVSLFRDSFRQNQLRNEKNGEQVDVACGNIVPPDLIVEAKDELAQSLGLLDALPERQRMVLYLIAVEDLPLVEVCKILDMSTSTAKANLSLARKRMREELLKRESSHKAMKIIDASSRTIADHD